MAAASLYTVVTMFKMNEHQQIWSHTLEPIFNVPRIYATPVISIQNNYKNKETFL
jgi:hypothetical protein